MNARQTATAVGIDRPAAGSWVNAQKPRLRVERASPDLTVAELREILASTGGLFERGVPVRLAYDQVQQASAAYALTAPELVLLAHQSSRPFALRKQDGDLVEVDVPLPQAMANMYLGWRGGWNLQPLNGIATVPLLRADGTIFSASGYDPESGMWLEGVPDVAALIPARPTEEAAGAALLVLRKTFRSFCFADATMVFDTNDGIAMVDLDVAPGQDESAFLHALLTAVCRASLWLAPAFLFRAAPMSGAGSGKGLLARCISLVAFGTEPHAVTTGANGEELEKRIVAELIEARQMLFLDNVNNQAFRSDLLASVITERPAKVRRLGRSEMVMLNTSVLVIITGNGLTVSEDLARRFIPVDFDAGMEDPESRPFRNDIKAEVKRRRLELLAAVLTIWRWGRQCAELPAGKPIGSFEQWGCWVRDPLVALGCKDPVERIAEAKERDGRRQAIAELFAAWLEHHHSKPVAIAELHSSIVGIVDPQGRGRQYLTARIQALTGTRIAGHTLTREKSAKWSRARYALLPSPSEEHRDHRGDRVPMTPMTPMGSAATAAGWRGRIE